MDQKKTNKLTMSCLWLGAFVNWVSYGFIYPIFAVALFQKDPLFAAGASSLLRGVLLGILIAASPLGQFFSSSFIGRLSDQKGRKPVLQITYLIVFLGYVLCAIGVAVPSLLVVILGRIITGCGAGNIAVINSAISDMSPSQEKTKNYALIGMASGVGFAVGPFLGGVLSNFGFLVPFIGAGLLSLITVLLFAAFFQETLERPHRAAALSVFSKIHALVDMDILRKLPLFLISFFIFCLGWSFYWEFIPVTWIKNYALDASRIGNFYAFGSGIYVVSSGILIRPIVKRFKPIPIMIFAFGMLTLSFIALMNAPLIWFWFAIAIQQFCVALIFPLGTTVVSDRVSKESQGNALGSFQSLQALAFAVTPLIGGILLDLNSSIPLLIGCGSMLISCLILILGKKS